MILNITLEHCETYARLRLGRLAPCQKYDMAAGRHVRLGIFDLPFERFRSDREVLDQAEKISHSYSECRLKAVSRI
jgi:hypothetical protein